MSAQAGCDGRRIGEVARMAWVHVETVRFYARQGIIRQPAKPPMGTRRYCPEVISCQRNLPDSAGGGDPVPRSVISS